MNFACRRPNLCRNTLEIAPLSIEDRKLLIQSYLAIHSKKVTATQMELMANASNSASPLFLRAMLDELRVSASFETLEKHIRSYVSCNSIPDLFDKILTRWEADYKSPSKPTVIRDALSLIATSRRGLSEGELIDLLSLNSAEWGRALLAMQESLLNHSGLLQLYHSHFEQVCQTHSHPSLSLSLSDF